MKQTEDFVLWTPSSPPLSPPYTNPCFKICLGALLSEHDVLSSKSCSHLPRHKHTQRHTHTHSQPVPPQFFRAALFGGSVSPPWFYCSGHRFTLVLKPTFPASKLASTSQYYFWISVKALIQKVWTVVSYCCSQSCRRTQLADTAHKNFSRRKRFRGV